LGPGKSATSRWNSQLAVNTPAAMKRRLYLLLALLGLVLPYYFFVSFLIKNGLDVQLLVDQLFASEISTFFAVDLIITAIVFLFFSYQESRRVHMENWWAYIVATLVVGPSFAFPLFLFFRESRIESPESISSE
jgi:hypothetical protein